MAKPKIRFNGYTEDWEQRKLIDLVDVLDGDRGKNYPTSDDFDISGHTLFLNASNVTNNGFLFQDNQFITEEKSNSMGNGKLEEDDIVVTSRGSLGHIAWYNADISSFVPYARINSGMLILRNKKEIETEYLYHFMKSSKGQSQISFISFGSAQPQLTKKGVEALEVILPTRRDEQVQLGHYFSNLDHLITLHQRKCEQTKTLKKYMLQKMFPQDGEKVPQIRFEGFTEDWEQRKLEDFGKATGGTSIESEFTEDGIYKVISIGSYSENSVYNDQGIRAIKSDKTNNRVLNRNDLTMILNDKTTSGNIIGRVLLIEESGIYVYNQRTERIEINLDEYDPVFLYEMLNAPNIREKIIKQAQGNTQIYVNWTAISLLEYMIPSKEEQVKIGEYLHSIDNLITLHQRKCDELKEVKKFMLQNMFV